MTMTMDVTIINHIPQGIICGAGRREAEEPLPTPQVPHWRLAAKLPSYWVVVWWVESESGIESEGEGGGQGVARHNHCPNGYEAW